MKRHLHSYCLFECLLHNSMLNSQTEMNRGRDTVPPVLVVQDFPEPDPYIAFTGLLIFEIS